MDVYSLVGTYLYEGNEIPQVGVIQTDSDSPEDIVNVSGFIADAGSSSPRHDLEGKLIQKDGKIFFSFSKRPQISLIGINYQLQKITKEEGLNGTYVGAWTHAEPGVHIGIGYDETGEQAAMFREAEKTNKAYFKIEKILGFSEISS
jgi:hypothetical protein